MGDQVDALTAQTQVGQQGLHHTGLLEDGVPVGPLGRRSGELWVSGGGPAGDGDTGGADLLTGLSLKPNPRKSRATTRWNR